MSRLAHGNEDHPEAALKHLKDAQALQRAARYDGTAYLAGYVVECALKAVLLHDQSFDPATKVTNSAALVQWHGQLRPQFGHRLAKLLAAQVGPEGARYMPPVFLSSSIVKSWSETMRYHPEGRVAVDSAAAFIAWAEVAAEAVVRMILDGVL